ncbi:MAG: hypothetical protein KatS3mg114_0344 [Planctomycetaceae bacterium]|nr:MAG: hypothetical protein KatS3mg114_0344 [Planctomycetaceae bacterium]
MTTVFIIGVDHMVGANFAVKLADQHRVVGISWGTNLVGSSGMVEPSRPTAEGIRQLIRTYQPARLVYCGLGASACWDDYPPSAYLHDVQRLQLWLEATQHEAVHWTYLSTDGIFTGPWMFHAENSRSLCRSIPAQQLYQAEQAVLSRHPSAFVVRTHAFGWSAQPCEACWFDRLWQGLQEGAAVLCDPVRHASPILVTDLIDSILHAWEAGLSGVYHIAGAERVNPVRFAQQLAQVFGLEYHHAGSQESLTKLAQGFGRGETSLQTRKIRRALGISLPLLHEGLLRLQQQLTNGHAARLSEGRTLSQVA